MNQCTPARRRECISGVGEQNIDIVCADCSYNQAFVPSLKFERMLFLYNLQNAGYPLKGNDATYEEWLELGNFKNLISIEITKNGNRK